ncbi:putative Transcriptional regulator, GntR family [Vibrio nigripulchritudo SFn27]|uniref:Putative Transcriptional regulator, GntR family n=1 Tax=Vibrio nigripulchritudo TaxID=28173 RepID=U4KE01_9VIBR|nr:FCD domain-containing protein [Vibrio nigripulchritudo]CCN83809.1 putative Transcriptional regulator, GntR family [Vibrio nigripulchritudo BLFn1]CCN87183.1 putative Transcriptional regulator, GntR family [Vibrio nigripulchritudo SFn27]CCN94539.1 putative Transcriptional regulator, GntR family [Vibrio nigripulchritudo ENn2]CCO40895.1 putative Transcriptional regulator, GntR family [Vibrio nigripulchritudo SFn135]CCO54974.1 putative Transcriptional regulator, GntR family [Vibrio nigripulchrit
MIATSKSLGTPRIKATKRKRSDIISEEVKRWVVAEGMVTGDRLPLERELTEMFDCAKGTLREALKSLEVQGLIKIKTGPNGGAVLAEVSFERTTELMRNYLHFQNLSIQQIYQFRKIIEVEMVVMLVGHLSEEDFIELEKNIGTCSCGAHTQHIHQQILTRNTELDFHALLAKFCPNPLLSFQCRFLSELLRDHILIRTDIPHIIDEFASANLDYHKKLVDALREENHQQVRKLMVEHIESAERYTQILEGVVSEELLLSKTIN